MPRRASETHNKPRTKTLILVFFFFTSLCFILDSHFVVNIYNIYIYFYMYTISFILNTKKLNKKV